MTLETAKKLKEAGWSKETYSVWVKQFNYIAIPIPANEMSNYDVGSVEYIYPCPSLEELLSEMPDKICGLGKVDLFFKLGKYHETYFVEYQYDGQRLYFHSNPDPTEAVAQLYLKLKQENLL